MSSTTAVFILLIVFMSLLAGIIKNYLRHKQEDVSADKHDEIARRLEALERLVRGGILKRIETLETIVTDRRYDLKKELKDLEEHG